VEEKIKRRNWDVHVRPSRKLGQKQGQALGSEEVWKS
jgi:hypothetical protein